MVRIDRLEEGEARTEEVDQPARRYRCIRQETDRPKAMNKVLAAVSDGQISRTDPVARPMATGARHSGMVGGNVQSAVNTETQIIVTHEVIPTASRIDRFCIFPRSDRADCFGVACKEVPSLTARLDDFFICVEDRDCELVGAQTGPDVFERIEFGGIGRQRQKRYVFGYLQCFCAMPARAIEHKDGMGARRDSL